MEWMAWTLPTALFFAAIALTLAVYSLLGLLAPSRPRRGFLRIATTRGDRLFIGLLASAYINLAWAGATQAPQWLAAVVWLPALWAISRWG